MRFSFAVAALFAAVAVDNVCAINLSAEPVLKKEEPKTDPAVVKAKFDAKIEEKKALDEKAVAAETMAERVRARFSLWSRIQQN